MSGLALMRALDWIPDNASRVVIDMSMKGPVKVYMELVGYQEELDVEPLRALTGAEIIQVNRVAVNASNK
jgi:hypothetical protein